MIPSGPVAASGPLNGKIKSPEPQSSCAQEVAVKLVVLPFVEMVALRDKLDAVIASAEALGPDVMISMVPGKPVTITSAWIMPDVFEVAGEDDPGPVLIEAPLLPVTETEEPPSVDVAVLMAKVHNLGMPKGWDSELDLEAWEMEAEGVTRAQIALDLGLDTALCKRRLTELQLLICDCQPAVQDYMRPQLLEALRRTVRVHRGMAA